MASGQLAPPPTTPEAPPQVPPTGDPPPEDPPPATPPIQSGDFLPAGQEAPPGWVVIGGRAYQRGLSGKGVTDRILTGPSAPPPLPPAPVDGPPTVPPKPGKPPGTAVDGNKPLPPGGPAPQLPGQPPPAAYPPPQPNNPQSLEPYLQPQQGEDWGSFHQRLFEYTGIPVATLQAWGQAGDWNLWVQNIAGALFGNSGGPSPVPPIIDQAPQGPQLG